MISKASIALIAILLASGRAHAQSMQANSRGYVALGVGSRLATATFEQEAVRRENVEDGHVATTYALDRGITLDVAAGVRVWRQLAIGVGVTRLSASTSDNLSASIPHPIFFAHPRNVSGEVGGLKREELDVNIQMREIVPVSQRVVVAIFGGPSLFQVKQGLITDLRISEAYPYDTAQFVSADTVATSKSVIGFNAGADFALFFNRNAGVGATVQFVRANVDAPGLLGTAARFVAGGPDVTAGMRLRF